MKTLGYFSPTVAPLVVAASLVLSSGAIYAAGAGGGGVAGGGGHGGGVGAVGVSSVGAGHGGGSASISSARGGVSFSNNSFRSAGGGLSRGGGFRSAGASSLSLPYHNVQNFGASPATRLAASPSISRPANAWSGLAVNQGGNLASNRGGTARSPNRYNNWSEGGFTGQRLNPGAPGANIPTYNRGNYGGRYGGYGNGRPYNRYGNGYYYYPYAYGPAYAPYISYFGGDYGGLGYYGGAYPYYNDVPSLDTSYENSPAATVTPQYSEQAPDNTGVQNQDSVQQPAPQRQEPSSANQGTIPNNGPDSLVEAVQEELVRRGYFGGKVDAMYNSETKEALRKFQTDHHLASTGLINEATLHALQLD